MSLLRLRKLCVVPLSRKSIYIFSDLNERAAMKAKALTRAAAVIPGEPVGPYHAHRGASLRSR